MQQPQEGRTANPESRPGQRSATNTASAARSQPTHQHQLTLPSDGPITMHSETGRQINHTAPLISFDDYHNAAIITDNRSDSEKADSTQNEYEEACKLTGENGQEDTAATRSSQSPVHDLLQNLVLGASSIGGNRCSQTIMINRMKAANPWSPLQGSRNPKKSPNEAPSQENGTYFCHLRGTWMQRWSYTQAWSMNRL